jgi:hypothetical protein
MEKTMSKAERVREALKSGATAKEAASLCGTTIQYVYDLKSGMNRANGLPKRRGRPPKVKAEVPMTLDVRSTKSSKEGSSKINLMVFENLVKETKKIEEEVVALRGIVSYLESKLVKHGFAV